MALPNTRSDREQAKFLELQDGSTAMRAVDPFAAVGTQREYISRILDTDGDGTGTKIATGNYADGGSGLTIFKIEPAAGEVFRLSRILIHYADTGPVNNGDVYGNGITLTNGITVTLTDAFGTDVSLTNDTPIMTNNEWGRFCYDINITDFSSGSNYYQARWTFSRGGQFLRLVGDEGHVLKVTLNDDFTGLDDQTFVVQGYQE